VIDDLLECLINFRSLLEPGDERARFRYVPGLAQQDD
jgi:hypothetical protein